MEVHKKWINNLESFCYPIRSNLNCEYQLGKRGLYPEFGGTVSQSAHKDNELGSDERLFKFNKEVRLTGKHINAYGWLMHLADGLNSNFDIAEKSNLPLSIINESISIFHQKNLLKIK